MRRLKAAFPAILIWGGALVALSMPGAAIVQNIRLRAAGPAAQAASEAGQALLAWASMFAVAIGMLMMVAGYVIRRARKTEREAAALRKARREADRARRRHSLD
jgi:hypothetical protein